MNFSSSSEVSELDSESEGQSSESEEESPSSGTEIFGVLRIGLDGTSLSESPSGSPKIALFINYLSKL